MSDVTSSTDLRVVVVGAGIVGVSTAWFLRRAGVDVRIVEAVAPSAGATGSADGAVSVASKRPGPLMRAALAGIRLYRDLATDGVLAGRFTTRSTFLVAVDDTEAAVLDTHGEALAAAGVSVERLGRDALRALAPSLGDTARSAVEVRGEGHAIGYDIVRRLITTGGLRIERRAGVLGLRRASDDGRLLGLDTEQGPIDADVVVVAAGGGSASLLGLDGVLVPRRGQLLVTERAPHLAAGLPGAIMSARYLLAKASAETTAAPSPRGYGLVIDPLGTGQFLIGGTRENDEERRVTDLEAVAHILADAVALMPGLADVRLLRSFAGLRTAVVDGLPLVGRLTGGVWVATGFEGDGICLGPLMGRCIADAILGRPTEIDLAPFDPARFEPRMVAA